MEIMRHLLKEMTGAKGNLLNVLSLSGVIPPKPDGGTSLSSGIYYFGVPYDEFVFSTYYMEYLGDNNINVNKL